MFTGENLDNIYYLSTLIPGKLPNLSVRTQLFIFYFFRFIYETD